MAAEDFFTRWSKKKADAAVEAGQDHVVPSVDVPGKSELITSSDAEVDALPTLEDVEKLSHDSDYSVFMARGVDESVKRSAMKKLFSNPHFNIMDGLDIYIDDYSKFEPISPALLASLNHAKALMDPLSQLKTPLMRMLEKIPESTETDAVEVAATALDNIPSPPDAENAADQIADKTAENTGQNVLSAGAPEKDYAQQQQHADDESQEPELASPETERAATPPRLDKI